MDKVKEIIKMPTYSRFLCDQLWFLPQGVGDFYVRIFCERAVDFSEKLQLTIAEIGSNLSRGVSVTNYLLGNRYHPGESFLSHGAGVGKRSSKRKAAEALEEEHKQHEQHDTSPEDMLKKIAEKGLVAKDLNMKILGKCKDKFGDHGKAAVVNSYVLHERLALVTPATALFCGTAKAIGSHLDVCRDGIPNGGCGVILVAVTEGEKRRVRSLSAAEVQRFKGWDASSFGLSLLGNPRSQNNMLQLLPPSFTVLSVLMAACAT